MSMQVRMLCPKHPVRFAVVVSVGLLLLGMLPWNAFLPELWAAWLPLFLRMALCLILIRRLGLWGTAGFRREGYGRGLLYGLPFYVIGLGSMGMSLLGAAGQLQFVSWRRFILFAFSMLLVGLNEELWLRSLVLHFLRGQQKGEWRALVMSAMIFGAIHFINLFAMPPLNVLLQAVNATAAGLLFGAIFLRCGNFWAVSTVHALVDFLSLLVGECFRGAATVLTAQLTPLAAVFMLLGGIGIPVAAALWLMKKPSACHLPWDKV